MIKKIKHSKRIIYFFSGVDGSGKSTHSRLLVTFLNRNGVRARLVWMRWFAFLSYPVLAICKFLGLTKRPSGQAVPVRLYWKVKPIAYLWLNLFILDYIIYMVTKLFSRSIIVADRFALDILVDVTYDTHFNPFKFIIGKAFYLLIYKLLRLKKIKGVIMLVDERTVMRRRSDIPSRTYIKFRISVYKKIAYHLGIPIIDGKKDLKKNFYNILKIYELL